MVEIRDGERISDDEKREVTLLVDIEQVGVVDVLSAPYCDEGPPLHVHRQHAEAVFVMDGELTFRLENGERRVGPETWVYVPPEVVHTFAVTGDSPARFLDLHVPNSGFGDVVRGLSSSFDRHPIPEYASADPGLVVVRRTGGGEGERITDRPERRATMLLEADELVVSEFFYGSGERGAQPHVHHQHADAFLVVEGELTMTVGDRTLVAPAGTFIVLPPDVVHGFDNDGPGSMLVYNFHLPASGFGDYLRGRNPDFDQHDPPADGGADPASVVAVRVPGIG